MSEETPQRAPQEPRSWADEPRAITREELVALFSVATVGLLVVVILGIRERDLTQWSDISGIISGSIFTLITLVVSAWWFLRRAPFRPRLNMSHEVTVVGEHTDGKQVMIAVVARFENAGDLPIYIDTWTLTVFEIPLTSKEFVEQFSGGGLIVDHQARWPLHIAGREVVFGHQGGSWVRSGEKQTLVAYVSISSNTEVLRMLSQIPHKGLSLIGKTQRAWTDVSIVDLRRRE